MYKNNSNQAKIILIKGKDIYIYISLKYWNIRVLSFNTKFILCLRNNIL